MSGNTAADIYSTGKADMYSNVTADVYGTETANVYGLWRAADRGDVARVRQLVLQQGADVNSRNCLGCVPLMYAAGSGHIQVVEFLLDQPSICVNIRNNDRLTTFMLAMQIGGDAGSWTGVQGGAQEQLKKLMDKPSLFDSGWARNDKWTILMEAASFGQEIIVDRLLAVSGLELDAINIRGQTAAEVAVNRNNQLIASKIEEAIMKRDNPEEVVQIQQLESQVEDLKVEARKRLLHNIDSRHEELDKLKEHHEAEMEPLTKEINRLQIALDESMKKRLSMITRQVSEVKRKEDDIQLCTRQLENFDRMYGMGGKSSPVVPPNNIFEKDFECPVCYEIMVPPSRIFQCSNGHLICEACKCHSEVRTCPTCRVPLGPTSLLRNIPMEKLAKTYFERCHNPSQTSLGGAGSAPVNVLSPHRDVSRFSSRRSSTSQRTISNGTPTWAHDDLDSRIFDWTQ